MAEECDLNATSVVRRLIRLADAVLHDLDVAWVHGSRQLGSDLRQARRHSVGATGALNERRRVGGDDHAPRAAKVLASHVGER